MIYFDNKVRSITLPQLKASCRTKFRSCSLGLSLLVGRVELLVVLGWKWHKTSTICRKVGCRCFCSFVGRPKVQTVKLVHQQKKLHAVLWQESWWTVEPHPVSTKISCHYGVSPWNPFRNSPVRNRPWGFHTIFRPAAVRLSCWACFRAKKSKTKLVFEKTCP